MIKEDYVSFEVAKLLKEKGFVGESEIGDKCGFYEQNKEYPSQINLVYDDLDNSELERNECLRFTLQMAMKWLREVHNIFISIDIYSKDFEGNIRYCVNIYKYGSRMILDTPIICNSYEEAIQAAIKYVLENLI